MARAALKKMTFKRRAPASSKSKRADRVSKARASTIRSIAKKVVMSSAERKYTLFNQIIASNTAIPAAGQVRTVNFTNQAGLYPAQGDGIFERVGESYTISHVTVFIRVQTTDKFYQHPLDVYVVKQAPRASRADASHNIDVIWPETQTTDAVSLLRVSSPVGQLESREGRILMKKTFYGQRFYQPSDSGFYFQNTGTEASASYVYDMVINVPVKKRVRATGTAAEIPTELANHYLLFHDRNSDGGDTHWNIRNVYSRIVYKDV